MAEPMYEVVWPLGRLAYELSPAAPRISDLRGKTVCELSNFMFRAEDVFPITRQLLQKQYPGIKFVDYNQIGNIHGWNEDEALATLPEVLRKHGCDAAIAATGA